jgi:hypothetical protein
VKLRQLSLFLVILFTSFQICFSQEEQKAVLFNKSGNVVPEEFAAIFETFYGKVIKNPTLQGYIVIHPKKNSINQNFRRERGYERFVKNLISIYKFDKSRITVVRSEEKDEIELEFWIVPHNAQKPFTIEEKWAEYIPDLTKAFVFGIDDEIYTFPSFIPEFYADYINNNANLRGHIVSFSSRYSLDVEKWVKILTEDYKIPRNRLKIFYRKTKREPYIEFWLVPKKKNR